MTGHESPPRSAIWAAGGVVYRLDELGKPAYLIVHRPGYDDWSLPKGKLDKREKFSAAATREVTEETGFKVETGPPIGTIHYTTPNGNLKIVRYWLMKPTKGRFRKNAEVDKIMWLRAKSARKRLSYERDRDVLGRAHEMVKRPSSSRILLVRHAHAGSRMDWGGSDRVRPVSKRGQKETSALHEFLSGYPITRVLSSPYLRCRQTVEPVAKTLGLAVENEGALEEGAHPGMLERLIFEAKGESAILCSHGDVIAGLIGHLAAENIPLHGPQQWEKASIWILEARNGRVVSGTYVPPLL